MVDGFRRQHFSDHTVAQGLDGGGRGGLGVVVGAFQGYVDARIKGEEDAEAAFINSGSLRADLLVLP